jgi:lysyl-tRNA synthetase class 2
MTAQLGTLKQRSEILRQTRDFFYHRDFWEVETPLLSQETVVDLYLEPLEIAVEPGSGRRGFLQTSPEFGMKRLLAAGATAIFQICKAFRAGERGARHNPEFTMLEWYRCGDGYVAGRQLLADLLQTWWSHRSREHSYRDVFLGSAQIDPFFADDESLVERAAALGFSGTPSPSTATQFPGLRRRQTLNFLWSELVEPDLMGPGPVIIYDWPAAEAALARTATRTLPDGRRYEVAERFELFVQGIELANGYHELLDPHVLAARNRLTNETRLASGLRALPDNDRLLAAMRHGIPACSGVALGMDRLVMALTQQHSIDDVIPFPWERA